MGDHVGIHCVVLFHFCLSRLSLFLHLHCISCLSSSSSHSCKSRHQILIMRTVPAISRSIYPTPGPSDAPYDDHAITIVSWSTCRGHRPSTVLSSFENAIFDTMCTSMYSSLAPSCIRIGVPRCANDNSECDSKRRS